MAEYQSIIKDTSQMKTWHFFIPMMIKCIAIPIIVIANLVL